MATTLHIELDDVTMIRLEEIASKNNTDPASMVLRYLSLLASFDEPVDPAKLPPISRSAYGMLKGLPDKPYKELLTDALEEKYGTK